LKANRHHDTINSECFCGRTVATRTARITPIGLWARPCAPGNGRRQKTLCYLGDLNSSAPAHWLTTDRVWGMVENLASSSLQTRAVPASRCIHIPRAGVCPGRVFITFGGPQSHVDRLSTWWGLATGLPALYQPIANRPGRSTCTLRKLPVSN
jgi:hypothetical protein